MDKHPAQEQIAVYVIAKGEGLLQLVDYRTSREQVQCPWRRSTLVQCFKLLRVWDREGMVQDCGKIARHRGLPMPAREISRYRPRTPPVAPREKEDQLRRGAESVRLSLRALAERLRAIPGRKSIFWVTEGFPPRVMHDEPAWETTVAALNDANVAVNTVDCR